MSGFVGDYADPFYFQIKKNVTAAELDAAGAERGDYGLMRSFRFQRGGWGTYRRSAEEAPRWR